MLRVFGQAAEQSNRGGHLVISEGKFRVVYAPPWPCMRSPAPEEIFENLKYNLAVKERMRLRLLSWLLLLLYVNVYDLYLAVCAPFPKSRMGHLCTSCTQAFILKQVVNIASMLQS